MMFKRQSHEGLLFLYEEMPEKEKYGGNSCLPNDLYMI